MCARCACLWDAATHHHLYATSFSVKSYTIRCKETRSLAFVSCGNTETKPSSQPFRLLWEMNSICSSHTNTHLSKQRQLEICINLKFTGSQALQHRHSISVQCTSYMHTTRFQKKWTGFFTPLSLLLNKWNAPLLQCKRSCQLWSYYISLCFFLLLDKYRASITSSKVTWLLTHMHTLHTS